jgi:AcrR family transcriptional regulator
MVPREQARTRLARAAVIGAARTLFVAHGFGATTIEAISARAGVPQPTVYRLFSSKLGILKSLVDVSIVGDDADVPLADRPGVRELFDDPDPSRRIAGFVSVVARVNARVAPLYRILVSASESDPEAATLLDELTRQRQDGQRTLSRSLARTGALSPGLKERSAADIVHALASPEVYRLLVVDRSWTPDRYERWLADILKGQLLPPVCD